MAVSKEILDLIPQGCKVNWNEKQQRFYVYKSTYYYSKEHKRSREQRTQVGTIVNGIFTYAKSYLLKQQIKDLKQEVKSSTADVVNKTSEILSNEVIDPRQAAKVQYPLAYVYLVALLSSLSGQTSCVQIADYWSNHRAALETVFEDFPMISLKYANGLRNGANSDTHRCKQLTEHGEERCIKLREVAGFSAVRTIFQIVGPRKILHCLLGK